MSCMDSKDDDKGQKALKAYGLRHNPDRKLCTVWYFLCIFARIFSVFLVRMFLHSVIEI